ncbi:hypothetical protein L249_3854 [Ophiocordyceps polyrhachis-furcata BCC 54312]|uniref:Ribosomal protein L1 n=1 Tax=Ophiocordyceps polyrhachis-furcata BCC 54312 TaxID=1330021 RepID=A0A367L5J9_9HYPO|nr:hypothetical protein L249_3854 [Ophiocordyceps polyrhachis-furcata BCC 54312]
MASSKEVISVVSDVVASIDADQTLKASKALLAHLHKVAKEEVKQPSSKRSLLEDDDHQDVPVWLTLTAKRHMANTARLKPGKIPLPHPLNTDETTTICAITADPQRRYKDIFASDEFPTALAKRITRVIDFSHLLKKYSQYEAQRKLLSQHDIFVADDRIINRLPKVLGKTFYRSTQKRPIPIILQAKRPKVDGKRVGRKKRPADEGVNVASAADMAKEIHKAIGCALVNPAPSVNMSIRVAKAHWSPEHVAENVVAVASALVEKWVPQQWRNVKGIYIKGPESAALPIWQTDELWLDEADVVPNSSSAGIERANVGKKRKIVEGAEKAEPPPPKAKKAKTTTPTDQGKTAKGKKVKSDDDDDDDEIVKQVAQRKATLRKHKAAAAKSAMLED